MTIFSEFINQQPYFHFFYISYFLGKYEELADPVIAGSAATKSLGVKTFVLRLRTFMWLKLCQLLAKMFGFNNVTPKQHLKFSNQS